MGVPKFFRYISERYPCLSEFVKEHQIPEFDHLYLDMNGIIHQCSHPDDYDPHFRISEEKIMADIFHYIEVLFRLIKPQRLFFMAIDGVAPRAKMNQQRGRRFRSAKDAERLEEKAKEKGEALPDAARFDSNCITPGTVFMAKLHEQLKYFIVNKITTDKLWSGCKVILSGHETPGEGEHKIMDYIRYMRAQPGYDPNTRHCLYGLDADLIMLGLCTHEPHFSLLREEVQFGKKSTKRKTVPEQITFFLLHLSLLREYLELEFLPLKEGLSFEYDFEKIIDDWVLMGFLVGNDFIPNLPNLHIASGALPLLYATYNKVLPTLDGYINEGGHLHLDRFQKYMKVLCEVDMNQFTEQYADLKYFESKTGRKPNDKERTSYKLKKLEAWQPEAPVNQDLANLIKATDDMFLDSPDGNLFSMGDDDDKSDTGSVSYDTEGDLLTAEFMQHKKDYYMNKLDYQQVTPEVLRAQAEGYVRAIQWNLHYYYNSVCSWSWYYPHHYSPYMSDIKDFKDLKLDYDLGTPFKPYEQLLGVLPAASKTLLPECYHRLMVNDDSPIKDYYPVNFETDLNGKRQEWEAVVLIPFIDEKRLLDAMDPCNKQLSPEEVQRNTHGPMLEYVYSATNFGDYEAPEYFPVIKNHHAVCTETDIKDIRVPREKLIKGAYPGAKMDVYYLGFPTFKHLKYTSDTLKAKVKVFDQPSRNENTIITIQSTPVANLEETAKSLIGKTVLVGWPHLQEALVVAVSSNYFRYTKNSEGELSTEEVRANSSQNWNVERCGIIDHYRDRLGIEVGETKALVQVRVMIGRKYVFTPQGRVNLEKQFSNILSSYPLQTVVTDISVHDEKYKAYKEIKDIYTDGSVCFNLGQPNYGCMGTVVESGECQMKGRVKVSLLTENDPDFSEVKELENNLRVTYMPLYVAASRIGISKHFLSRITGTLLVVMGPQRAHGSLEEDSSKINIGLNLKYNKKNEEIPGYTKKDRDWLYSQKAVDLVMAYLNQYPQMLESISSSMGNDIFYEYELFPEDEGSGKTVKEIADWIKKQPFYSVERRMCGSIILEPDVVARMERIVDEHTQNVKSMFMQIKPDKLYKPDIQMGNLPPDPATTYQLYDRVINVRESYTVPIGYTGTVIAIHKSHNTKPEDVLYDVLFDKEFAGGLALNCSNNRGYRMSRVALINKSHGIRDMEQKTGRPGELLQKLSGTNVHYQNNARHSNYQSPNNKNYQNSNSAFVSWNTPPYNQYNSTPPTYQTQNQYYNKSAANNVAQKSPQKSLVNFMPNFQSPGSPAGSNNRPQRAAQQQPPVVQDQRNQQPPAVQDQRNQQQQYAKKNQKVETNILKEILQITPEAGESSQTKTIANNSNTSKSFSVQDIFAHASAKMQSTPPRTAPDASQVNYGVQLLSFYQMQGLGCPHYNYFNTPDGQCQAQLSLPFDKEPIFGMPAKTRELACENVAKATLEKLKSRPVQQQGVPSSLPMKFPTPPRQWCDTDSKKANNKGSQKNRNHGGNKNAHYEDKRFHAGARQPDPVPFIPLQAVRKQREHKPHDSSVEDIHSSRNSQGESASQKQAQQHEINVTSSQNVAPPSKPRRERKNRIAANFSMLPNKS